MLPPLSHEGSILTSVTRDEGDAGTGSDAASSFKFKPQPNPNPPPVSIVPENPVLISVMLNIMIVHFLCSFVNRVTVFAHCKSTLLVCHHPPTLLEEYGLISLVEGMCFDMNL